MLYSEASYYDGFAFAHIAAWEEQLRRSSARRNYLRDRRANRR